MTQHMRIPLIFLKQATQEIKDTALPGLRPGEKHAVFPFCSHALVYLQMERLNMVSN